MKRIGFFNGITLVFVGLKLLGEIEWSWVWITSPTWIIFVTLLSFYKFKKENKVGIKTKKEGV